MSIIPYWMFGDCKYDCFRCGDVNYVHPDFVQYRKYICDICETKLFELYDFYEQKRKERGSNTIYNYYHVLNLCYSPKCTGKVCPKCHDLFCEVHIFEHVHSCKGKSKKKKIVI